MFANGFKHLPNAFQAALEGNKISFLNFYVTFRSFDYYMTIEKQALLLGIVIPVEYGFFFCPNGPLADAALGDFFFAEFFDDYFHCNMLNFY